MRRSDNERGAGATTAARESPESVRRSARGTHKGDLNVIKPTGKAMSISGISVCHFAGGKMCGRVGQLGQSGHAAAARCRASIGRRQSRRQVDFPAFSKSRGPTMRRSLCPHALSEPSTARRGYRKRGRLPLYRQNSFRARCARPERGHSRRGDRIPSGHRVF